MPSTPAKVEGCPSRCRHPSSAFLRKLSPVGSAQKRANLKPPIARQLFYQMYCQTDRKGDTGQQQINRNTEIPKRRNLPNSVVYLNGFINNDLTLIAKNENTNTTPPSAKYLHSHPSLVLAAFLRLLL